MLCSLIYNATIGVPAEALYFASYLMGGGKVSFLITLRRTLLNTYI